MEKTLMKKKIASIGNIENFLFDFEKLLENLGDDEIKSEGLSLIADICLEKEICPCCYTKIDEAEFDTYTEVSCNCGSKTFNHRMAGGF